MSWSPESCFSTCRKHQKLSSKHEVYGQSLTVYSGNRSSPGSPNRKSLVFDNKAGFIKLCSFHFPILTLTLTLGQKLMWQPLVCVSLAVPLPGDPTAHPKGYRHLRAVCNLKYLQRPGRKWPQFLCEAIGNSGCPELSVLGSHGSSAPGRAASSLSHSV